MGSKKSVATVLCGVLGVACVVTGVTLIHTFSDMIHTQVQEGIKLKNGSAAFKRWQLPSTPIYFQAWVFDIVNHEEVLQGEKPVLIQKGPYTYRGSRERYDISFTQDGTVRYRVKRTFHFEPNMSAGSENDWIHSINLPLLTIASVTRNETETFKKVANDLLQLTGEKLFLNVSVHGLLWGYEESLLKTIKLLAEDLHIKLNFSDTFGLFKNATDDGLYEIYSGVDGVDNFGEIVTWNGLDHLDYWADDAANMINGTDGNMYPPFIDTSTPKYLFSSDLCRSIALTHSETVKVSDIELEKFVANVDLLANATTQPGNRGFCTPADNCLPSGLLDLAVCKKGAPVVMSMPHFLGCDQKIIQAVRGLNPRLEEHQSFLSVEPMTGISMQVGKKLQVNYYIDYVDGYPFTSRWKEESMYLPIMWMNQSAIISNSNAEDFKEKVSRKIAFTEAVQYCLIGVGAFILTCVVLGFIKSKPCTRTTPTRRDSFNSAFQNFHVNIDSMPGDRPLL